jgi:hypothetical protein
MVEVTRSLPYAEAVIEVYDHAVVCLTEFVDCFAARHNVTAVYSRRDILRAGEALFSMEHYPYGYSLLPNAGRDIC